MSACHHWHRRGDACLICWPLPGDDDEHGLDAPVTPAAARYEPGWPEAWPQEWGASEGAAAFPVREVSPEEVAWHRIEAHSRLVHDRLGALVSTVAYPLTMVERRRQRVAATLRRIADWVEPHG